MTPRIARLLALILALSGGSLARAAEVYVPEALEPWRAWVLETHPAQPCPPLYLDAAIRQCLWASSLQVDAAADGARFVLAVELFAPADVTLPGGPGVWPVDVVVAADAGAVVSATVTQLAGRPRIRLEPGRYTVSGGIEWPRLPDAIDIPRHHGLLRLSVAGQVVPQPLVQGRRLWLGRAGAADTQAVTDSLEARVYRRIDDGVPLMVETTLDLSVGGSHRIATLGRALLEGFAVTGLESALPARVDRDGNLQVQVEPGDWRIILRARARASVDTLGMAATTAGWPDQEIWGFAAARGLRSVAIEGAAPIDLSQTGAPFQDLPGYLVTPETRLRLVEQFRGDPNPTPDDYRLNRNAWLGFDGATLVLQDRFEVTAAQPSRLSAAFVPGRVTVDGEPQLVTRLGEEQPGIELPQGAHQVLAVSEVERGALDTVLGWQVDASFVDITLHLPPAWRLLWASGVDRTPTAWLSQWNVWNLFLVMVTVFAALRLLGFGTAMLAGATLVVVYHEPGSPTYVWIVMLVLLAGLRVSRQGVFRRILSGLYFAVLFVTLGATVLFAIDGFRKATYPQLERPNASITEPGLRMDRDATVSYEMLESAAQGEIAMDAAPDRKMITAVAPSAAPSPATQPPTRENRYPPDLRVQTGPAVPEWRWTEAPLGWDGPVTAAQTFSLTLAPPALTRALYVAGPVLLLTLLAVFGLANLPPTVHVPEGLRRFLRRPGTAAAPMLALLAGLIGGLQAMPAIGADFPGPELLGELERRLVAAPECMPGCATVERVLVRLDERSLSLEMLVHADAPVAVPVLRADGQWQPAAAQSDGRPATMTRDDEGRLLVALPRGRHVVTLSGPVLHLDRFELTFLMPPGVVGVEARDWDVYGMDDGRLRGAALQFARQAGGLAGSGVPGQHGASLRSDPIAPYYMVERELRFGREWRTTTTVRRIAPGVGVIPFSVPQAPGESVLSGQVTAADGKVTGVLGPDQFEQRYESTLAEAPTLALTAPPLDVASERWTLVPSNLWHLEAAGVPATKTEPGASAGPRFDPLPGETLTITLTRPTAVPGDSMTLQRMDLAEEPGRRARRSNLTLDVLSSLGGVYPVTLPADARILEISVNGMPVPIPSSTGPLPLPVVPGEQSIGVAWESPNPVAFRTATSTPELPGVARNVNLSLALPEDRWPLLVGGPALGPAITWWSILLLVLLIAVALARVPGLPLTTRDALLAGLGMSLCNLPGTVIVAVWLLVMLARRRAADRLTALRRRYFNLIQAVLALFGVIAVLALAGSVPLGLLGTPDMYIDGNGSSAHLLRWYQDQATTGLPSAWVVSAPLWIYRLAMLAWSLWLAFALMRWVRWAWESYATGGAWRGRHTSASPASSDSPG